jgi:hypothetical protein
VDFIPSCKFRVSSSRNLLNASNLVVRYIPQWFPGATFRKLANSWKLEMKDSFTLPFKAACNFLVSHGLSDMTIVNTEHYVKQGTGNGNTSSVVNWLRKNSEKPDGVEKETIGPTVQFVAGSALFAGYETVGRLFRLQQIAT